jgi:hypothetical protein
MMSEYDKAALSSVLARLRGDDFRPFIELLKDRIRDRTDTLRNTSDTVVIYRMQGQIHALKDLLVTIGGDPNFS